MLAPWMLADGTLAVLRAPLPGPKTPGYLGVRTSRDGGDSFSEERVVAEYRVADTPYFGIPAMAADPARPGRLYFVWQDELASGRAGIRFAASADKGATFSAPVWLSEQPEALARRRLQDPLGERARGRHRPPVRWRRPERRRSAGLASTTF